MIQPVLMDVDNAKVNANNIIALVVIEESQVVLVVYVAKVGAICAHTIYVPGTWYAICAHIIHVLSSCYPCTVQ